MPIYNYVCDNCGDEFEENLPISAMDDPCEDPCVKCEMQSLRHKIGGNHALKTDVLPKLNDDFKENMRRIKKAHKSPYMPDY